MTETPTLAVRGEAVREVEPELAQLSVTVAARDKDRETTLARLATRVDALRALLDRYDEAIERRETSGMHIRPETRRSGERIRTYTGSVTTTVTFSDFTQLGEVALSLADQDQTSVYGPFWSLRPDSDAHRETRRAAIADVFNRAREYAEALGSRLVRMVELADSGLSGDRGPGQPIPLAAAAPVFRGAEATPQLDLEPQRQIVYAAVEARFEITEPSALS